MANQDAAFGLRPARSSTSANTQNRYRIAANYNTSIFQGDLVAMVTGGGIERVAAGGSGFHSWCIQWMFLYRSNDWQANFLKLLPCKYKRIRYHG